MKRLIYPERPENEDTHFYYPEDVDYIVKLAAERGLWVERYDAQEAWADHSGDLAASWMWIDRIGGKSNEYILNALHTYLVEVDN
jgi:hypothetical protein